MNNLVFQNSDINLNVAKAILIRGGNKIHPLLGAGKVFTRHVLISISYSIHCVCLDEWRHLVGSLRRVKKYV